jgi:hypothetical protein
VGVAFEEDVVVPTKSSTSPRPSVVPPPNVGATPLSLWGGW